MSFPGRRSPAPSSDSRGNHAPATPSGLRQSYTLSSSPTKTDNERRDSTDERPVSPNDASQPSAAGPSTALSEAAEATETTGLLPQSRAHPGRCSHGTFSPRASSPDGSFRNLDDEGVSLLGSDASTTTDGAPKGSTWTRRLTAQLKSQKMRTSSVYATEHGLEDTYMTYISYYIPGLVWMRQYSWAYFRGDVTAALTIASMYLPMALSYAENLAHVPPINGIYSFVFMPFVYGILGSCPQMIVGPEAAGSLLIGSIVKTSIDLGRGEDDNDVLHAKIAGVAVGMAGATVFIMGIARLGFLDSVLSRPFLRGFISAIGVVIFIDQLVPVLGLQEAQRNSPGVGHGSSVDKLTFLFSHLAEIHKLTAIVGVTSFAVIMLFREVKRRLQPRYPAAAYFPDRLLVVVLSGILTYQLGWYEQGLEILGNVKPSNHLFEFRNPFQTSHMSHIRDAMGTSFLIGMLGFFESSVAAKSLGSGEIEGMQLSPNRELIALGVANLLGACFMAIPAFGGYGRSKVNKSTGGKTPMSSIILSIFSVITVLFLLPWFYYLPKAVLSSLIIVVAWSLIEEAPHDVLFFLKIHGWTELWLIAVILLVTVFFSLNLGIAIGIGISLMQVIRRATQPRIQILGRVPNTERFEDAERRPERLEFIEGCLIVKIPEPLTFANTGQLKSRLRRLELYGTNQVHPAMPRRRQNDPNKNIIFDIHGVTGMDGSGTQVLTEIVQEYRDKGVRVFFSRGPPSKSSRLWRKLVRSGIVELVGGENHFVDDVKDALKMTESEDWEITGACATMSDDIS